MIRKKCPGADSIIKPHPEFINCPYCKAEIEMWTDETEAKCDSCGKQVKRTGVASCLDWCKFAEKCLGEKEYKDYKKRKKGRKA